MSIKLGNKRAMKVSNEEYRIIMDMRKLKEKLVDVWPGSIVIHIDSGGNIGKHEFHLAPLFAIKGVRKEVFVRHNNNNVAGPSDLANTVGG